MGNLKTCDIHDKEFPANLIDTDKTTMYKLYIEKTEQDPQDAKKKRTVTVFVGSSANEGVDCCHKCTIEAILKRIEAVGGKVSWKQVKWKNEEYTDKDGNKKTKLVKSIEEI